MTRPTLMLPSNPLDERRVDPMFSRESTAMRWLDVDVALVDHDRLEQVEPTAAFRQLPAEGARVLYRGWMMRAESYAVLVDALVAKNFHPVTTTDQFERAHYLPGWIDVFSRLTPKTVFVSPRASSDEIRRASATLHSESFVVKDWVKSRKSDWDTACFAANAEALPAVVAEFIRLQDTYLVGDIALRAYVPLDDSKTEIRIWWAHGEVALITPHPDAPDGAINDLPAELLQSVKACVDAPGCSFVTTDLAATAAGGWTVIEVGDGQVSGLPESVTPEQTEQLLSRAFGL